MECPSEYQEKIYNAVCVCVCVCVLKNLTYFHAPTHEISVLYYALLIGK